MAKHQKKVQLSQKMKNVREILRQDGFTIKRNHITGMYYIVHSHEQII